MIALDTNVLLYAHVKQFPRHDDARRRLEGLARGNRPWALPLFCIGEFLRVATHPRILSSPFTTDEAFQAIDRLLSCPTAGVLRPGDGYLDCLRDALRESGATGNLVHDAQIVALCREHGVRTLLTHDRDFLRFRSLAVETLD